MKKILYTYLILNSFTFYSQPQVIIPESGCPINTITTNPNNYQNSSDPNELQKWNWMTEDYTIYLATNQSGTIGIPTTIRSPFYDQSGNINTYHLAFEIQKDNKPEDGWELMYRNFGSEAQGLANSPFFMLYNRYTGVIRVFANIINSGESTYNAAKLELTFKDNSLNQTALLNQLGSHTFSFMDFQSEAYHFQANQYTNAGVNNNYFWVWADFNTLYDPCTCGVESNMWFRVGLINNIDIKMNGFLRQITMVDAVDDNSTTVNNLDFFGKVQKYLQFGSGIITGAGEVAASGTKGFKAGTDLISEAQKNVTNLEPMLGKQTTKNISEAIGKILFEVPKVNQMLNLASTLITVVKKLRVQAGALNDEASVEAIKSPSITEIKTSVELNGTLEVQGTHLNNLIRVPGSQNSTNTNVTNFKPVYNNVLGVVGFSEQPEFEIVQIPVSNDKPFIGPYDLTESIQKEMITNIIDYTREKYQYLNVFFTKSKSELMEKSLQEIQEYYSDMMGSVVNFNFQEYIDYILSQNYLSESINAFTVFHNIFQLKLKNNPQVIINPASNLKIKEIDYQFVFTHVGEDVLMIDQTDIPIPASSNILSGIYKHFFKKMKGPMVPGNLKYFDYINYYAGSIPYSSNREDFYTNIGYDLNSLDLTNNSSLSWDSSVFSTPYLNQACFKNIGVFSFSNIIRPELRIKVILEPINSNSGVNEVINIYSLPGTITKSNSTNYSVQNIGSGTPYIQLPNNLNNSISGYPSDLLLQNQNIISDIFALGDITIAENVYLSPNTTIQTTGNIYYKKSLLYLLDQNYFHKLIAGKEIIAFPETEAYPQMEWIIDPSIRLICENTSDDYIDPVTIKNKCNSIKYRELISKSMIQDYIDIENSINQNTITSEPFDFTLYPNPANAQTRIALQNSTFNEVSASVYDVMGKKINVEITQIGENSLSLNVSHLEKGVYFVKVKSNFEEKTKQLVVN
jgi:hypothetical protein